MHQRRWLSWLAGSTMLVAGLLGCRGRIEGVVKDPDGGAVSGALVAAILSGASREAMLVKSDPQGRFNIAELRAGSYTVTATAAGRVGAYRERVQVATRGVQWVELRMAREGLTLRGSLADRTGRPVGNATIRAFGLSPLKGSIFIGKNEEDGAFALTLPSGEYMVLVEAADFGANPKIVEGSGDTVVEFELQRAFPADKPPPREVTEWLRANAISLATPEAGHGIDDLRALKQIVGKARVVALGEATHGTREFFQLKHRILEFLATEMGFTVFAIEASYPDTLVIDDYVLNGRGDPTDALAAIRFWTWDTEEVLDQIQWMRRYNEDPSHQAKLEFQGFDMQSPSGAVQRAVEYLEKVDPAFARKVAPIVAPLDNDFDVETYPQLPGARLAMVREGLVGILKRLGDRKESYQQRAGTGEWAVAIMSAKVAIQGEEYARTRSYGFRDRSMAENIKALLDQRPSYTRMVVWAHNGHVAKEKFPIFDPMGKHLAKMFDEELVVFGFAFNQGSFRAMQIPFGRGGLATFTVPPAPPGSLDAALATAGKLFAIDLRRAPSGGIVSEWLSSRLRHREIGAGFSDETADEFFGDVIPRRSFDALLFVERTSSAKGNPSAMRSAPHPNLPSQQKLKSLENSNFEEASRNGQPTGWIPYTGAEKSSYSVASSEDKPFHGQRCGSIIREQAPWRWGYGALFQSLDAAHYRGKRIRFRAAARAEISGVGNRSELFVRVFSAKAQLPQGAFSSASTMDNPVQSASWQFYEVEAAVPPEADSINVGFALAGNGRAWFDDASLEIMDETASH